MITVAIESPFSGTSEDPHKRAQERQDNLRYLAWAIRDCYDRGEAPYAGHGLGPCAYAEDPASRAVGLAVDAKYRETCDVTAYYVDRGWSSGMRAHINQRPIPCLDKSLGEEERHLPEPYWQAFMRGEWPPGATVRWVPTPLTTVPPDWSDPMEDDVLAALQLIIRAQVSLVEAEGDPEQIRRLDRASEELEKFTAGWRA